MSLEMDIRTLRYIFTHHKAEWKEPSQRLFVIDEQAPLSKYEKLIEQMHPTVVMIDSLTELLDIDDDVSPDIKARRVMRWCRRIRRQYQTAIVLIHHNRKATEGNKKPKSLSDLAGSFQFGKDSDTVVQLWQDFKGLEFSTVKTRFGPKLEFQIVRNSNLWYSRKDEVASNRPEPVQSDTTGTTGFTVSFGGHGDKLHEQTPGEIPTGTGDND
jgi:predicted ATP-dependent serine protease